MVKILANIRFEKGRLGLSPVKESFQCDPPGDQCYLHIYIEQILDCQYSTSSQKSIWRSDLAFFFKSLSMHYGLIRDYLSGIITFNSKNNFISMSEDLSTNTPETLVLTFRSKPFSFQSSWTVDSAGYLFYKSGLFVNHSECWMCITKDEDYALCNLLLDIVVNYQNLLAGVPHGSIQSTKGLKCF